MSGQGTSVYPCPLFEFVHELLTRTVPRVRVRLLNVSRFETLLNLPKPHPTATGEGRGDDIECHCSNIREPQLGYTLCSVVHHY